MTTFKDLKSQWETQPEQDIPNDGTRLITDKINRIKKKQGIARSVLVITTLILIGFFFYIKAFKVGLVSFALGLMIASLLIRVLIEYFSTKKLNRIDITMNSSSFSKQMIAYYKKRIQTHYIATPIIIVCYSIGFIILLPFFKKSLSNGFYNYIIVSAIIVLLVLLFFIAKQIKAELLILKKMQ